jgi:membrane associated rhomboid family serine protease
VLWLLPWGQENRVKHMSWAVYGLIAINIVVFAWLVSDPPDDTDAFARTYGLLADDWRWYQFLTANFLHADIVHLFGNMLFLWLFGDSIEDAIGPVGFLALYFVGGFLGDLVYVHNNAGSDIPSLGASGCVSAIAGAYAILFYDRAVTLRLMLFVFPLRTFDVMAFWVVLFWLGADVWRTMASSGQLAGDGGVNYVSHGIGFVCGSLFGMVARLHGVMRRYERLAEGGRWSGYWSQALEQRNRRAFLRK